MSDKRSVATDALETLGTILHNKEKRDAIHLAVIRVQAERNLKKGEDVGVDPATANDETPIANGHYDNIGIVDPFLTVDTVKKGQEFWLVIYPRKITSLRHVWSHPAFADETVIRQIDDSTKQLSKEWIRRFAESISQDYDSLMAAAKKWDEEDERTYDNSESYKNNWGGFDEFWDHYEIVTGKVVANKQSFFACSC